MLHVSLIFQRPWISDLVSGNAMRDEVKDSRGFIGRKTTGHGKEIRASHDDVETSSKTFDRGHYVQKG